MAAVDVRERSIVEWLRLFITQMAAVSCADTQIPETTVATQSLPKVGFRKAIQLEVLVISIEAKCCLQQYHLGRYRVRQVINSHSQPFMRRP